MGRWRERGIGIGEMGGWRDRERGIGIVEMGGWRDREIGEGKAQMEPVDAGVRDDRWKLKVVVHLFCSKSPEATHTHTHTHTQGTGSRWTGPL